MDSKIDNINTSPENDKTCTCGKKTDGTCDCQNQGKKDCSSCDKKNKCACSSGTHKLEVFDWLCDLPEAQECTQMVEVQFKNTRKGYYLNSNNIELYKGDIVAVEAMPGHDIGEVTLTGKLVLLQMKKTNYRPLQGEHKRVYRIAKPSDIEKCTEAKAKEHQTMLRAREIAEELNLNMKISDVEYQGDGNKAIFYYIADERVDFRQLIKVYAEKFRVKIEMKQIGARQEAGRVGGIGPCGRELCCSGSISSFVSVSTSAARYQDISLNPQKLAGQCGKLKCCLNYEVDIYVEAQRQLPSREIVLETRDSAYYHFKTDILSGMMTYSTDKHFAANLVSIDKDRAFEVIQLNKRGKRPLNLASDENKQEERLPVNDILAQENIDRFDETKKKKKNSRNGNNQNRSFKPKDRNNTNTATSPASNNSSEDNQAQNNKPKNNKKKFNKPNKNKNNQEQQKPLRNNNDKRDSSGAENQS